MNLSPLDLIRANKFTLSVLLKEEEFKKRFPNLAKEMEKGESKADLNFTIEIPKARRKFSGYDPNETDFIRRCNTIEEAREIINYLEYRKEISIKRAEELRTQLENHGLRSFGRKKVKDYYEREG